jgi:hypothetical protein
MIRVPKTTDYAVIATDNVRTNMALRYPQIVSHTAFIPIITRNAGSDIFETIRLIEEFKLEQDIIVKDDGGGYSSAVYVNNQPETVIIPPATHLKGGKQNRGNNSVEILRGNETKTVSVNCFEPGRGSGSNRFTSFEDVPPEVARATMANTGGYDGSWNAIEEYTRLVGSGRSALTEFNRKTMDDRAKYALNFETCMGQTGACIITKGLSMVEVFPNPNVFNIYRERIVRGKLASLFYKIQHKNPDEQILPSEIDTKLKQMIDYVENAINLAVSSGQKMNGLIVGKNRSDGKAMDIVLTDGPNPEVVYIFGVW